MATTVSPFLITSFTYSAPKPVLVPVMRKTLPGMFVVAVFFWGEKQVKKGNVGRMENERRRKEILYLSLIVSAFSLAGLLSYMRVFRGSLT